MKPKLIAVSVAAALAGLSASLAHAEQPSAQSSPYYLSFGLGTSMPPDWSTVGSSGQRSVFVHNDGDVARFAIGKNISSYRVELEYLKARFSLNSLKVDGTIVGQSTGKEDKSIVSVNAYYDFFTSSNLSSHLGIGVGRARMSSDWTNVTGNTLVVRGSDTVTAYRLIFGFNYLIKQNWALGMDYRHEVTDDATFNTAIIGGPGAGEGPVTYKSNDQDSVLVNLTYRF